VLRLKMNEEEQWCFGYNGV